MFGVGVLFLFAAQKHDTNFISLSGSWFVVGSFFNMKAPNLPLNPCLLMFLLVSSLS